LPLFSYSCFSVFLSLLACSGRLTCLLLLVIAVVSVLKVLIKGGHGKHEEEGDPVVIGGMVLDIHATPSLPLNPRTTTPGKVCIYLLKTLFLLSTYVDNNLYFW